MIYKTLHKIEGLCYCFYHQIRALITADYTTIIATLKKQLAMVKMFSHKTLIMNYMISKMYSSKDI